jgi:chromosome segregation ATPase
MEMDTERIAKLETQVEAIKEDVKEMKGDIREIHSRITTQTREVVDKIDQLQTRLEHKMQAQAVAASQQHEEIQRAVQADIQDVAKTLDADIKEVNSRVDILERWRWMIVGGAIVLGYIIGNLDPLTKLFK